MTEAFVVDASVGFAWVYPSQSSAESDQLLKEVESGASVVVPSLWFLEIANGLLSAQRRKLMTTMERKVALNELSGLKLTVDEISGEATFRRISDLAERHGLSVYDAVYLEAAIRHKLPLGSRDQALRAAAKRCGLKVRG